MDFIPQIPLLVYVLSLELGLLLMATALAALTINDVPRRHPSGVNGHRAEGMHGFTN